MERYFKVHTTTFLQQEFGHSINITLFVTLLERSYISCYIPQDGQFPSSRPPFASLCDAAGQGEERCPFTAGAGAQTASVLSPKLKGDHWDGLLCKWGSSAQALRWPCARAPLLQQRSGKSCSDECVSAMKQKRSLGMQNDVKLHSPRLLVPWCVFFRKQL